MEKSAMNFALRSKKSRVYKISLIWLFIVMMLFSGHTVSAQSTQSTMSPNVGRNLSVARCIAKGNLDFGAFLNSVIASDGLIEGIIEPFKDILMRNKCHSNDISNLVNQRDKIRRYIRDAFLTCNTQKLPNLKTAFNKMTIEIYYARNVVDGKIMASLPFDLLSTRMLENPNSLYVSNAKLYAEMKLRFVDKGVITQPAFDAFFAELDFKYQDRKKNYVICQNDSWEQVAIKWREFINTAGGMGPALRKAAGNLAGRAEKIKEAVTDKGLSAYLGGLIHMNVANLPAKEGFSDIYKNLKKNLPNLSLPSAPAAPATKEQLFVATQTAAKDYKMAETRTALVSKFETLYKETSDFMVELIVTELDDFNSTLLSSFAPLDRILRCTETMNKKQCPNKRH